MSDPKGSSRRPEWQNISCRLYRYWIPFYRIKVSAVWVVVTGQVLFICLHVGRVAIIALGHRLPEVSTNGGTN
jgi:hypothetical protein